MPEKQSCPVCAGYVFGATMTVGRFQVRRCMGCDVLVNLTALADVAGNEQRQLETSEQFYSAAPSPDEIENARPIVQFMLDRSQGLPRGIAVDFGAGRGALAAAAAGVFSESWALDINTTTLQRCADTYSIENMHVTDNLAELPRQVDAIFAWHTVEHIPSTCDLVSTLAGLLAPRGAFLWQVPMFKPEYVVDTHFTFFNEHSAEELCVRAGMEFAGAWRDLDNHFLTVLARNPG